MKIKLPVLILSLIACGFAGMAQDNNAIPAAPPPAEAGAASTNATPSNPNDVVPLIVIDEVPLTDAIRNLARQSNLNFQFDPRILATNQPNVSIRFENVTAQEALGAVLENYNLALVQDSKSKIARVTVKDPKAEEPLVSQIVQLKYSDPTNLITIVKTTLSPRSQVVADPRTSQLIVTTTKKEMDGVLDLIGRIDTPTKQVLIEARLLETSKKPSSVKGVNWSGTFEAQNVSLGNNAVRGVPGTPPTTAVDANGNVTSVAGTSETIGGLLSGPKVLLDTARGGLHFNPATAFLNADGVSAVLSFLNKDSDTEVISTPRAVTLDNQTAILSATRAFPIFNITPGSANSAAGAQITYTNLGTILHVTPRIAADNNIALKVAPELSSFDGTDAQTLNGTVNTANIYAIRRIETQVMIPSGNTLVMGGLISDSATKNYTKVPLLGDIPGVGALFRSSNKQRQKSNLLIFITPTIVEEGAFHASTSGSEFLQTRMAERAEEPETAFDSAKPHDWTKPVY